MPDGGTGLSCYLRAHIMWKTNQTKCCTYIIKLLRINNNHNLRCRKRSQLNTNQINKMMHPLFQNYYCKIFTTKDIIKHNWNNRMIQNVQKSITVCFYCTLLMGIILLLWCMYYVKSSNSVLFAWIIKTPIHHSMKQVVQMTCMFHFKLRQQEKGRI